MGHVGRIRAGGAAEARVGRSVPSFNNEPDLVQFLRGREMAPIWVGQTLREVQRTQQGNPHTPIALVESGCPCPRRCGIGCMISSPNQSNHSGPTGSRPTIPRDRLPSTAP